MQIIHSYNVFIYALLAAPNMGDICPTIKCQNVIKTNSVHTLVRIPDWPNFNV